MQADKMRPISRFSAAVILSLFAGMAPAFSQQVTVPFGNFNHDTKQEIEIVSDSFSISQNKGTAEFQGNVVVGQGDLRISAEKITVEYATENGKSTGKIGSLKATGGVTLVSGGQAAEAQSAVYSIKNGSITMEGDVLLTQGENALAGQKVIIDLKDGSARVEGRVKTIFKAGSSE